MVSGLEGGTAILLAAAIIGLLGSVNLVDRIHLGHALAATTALGADPCRLRVGRRERPIHLPRETRAEAVPPELFRS